MFIALSNEKKEISKIYSPHLLPKNSIEFQRLDSTHKFYFTTFEEVWLMCWSQVKNEKQILNCLNPPVKLMLDSHQFHILFTPISENIYAVWLVWIRKNRGEEARVSTKLGY